MSSPAPPPQYITATDLLARYGKKPEAKNWLARRIANDAAFPRPISFGGRDRYFSIADLEQWERLRAETPLQMRRPGKASAS